MENFTLYAEVPGFGIGVAIVAVERDGTQRGNSSTRRKWAIQRQRRYEICKEELIQNERRIPDDFRVVAHVVVVINSATGPNNRAISPWAIGETKPRCEVVQIVPHQLPWKCHAGDSDAVAAGQPHRLL